MAERAGGIATEVDASHGVMLTHPRAVAEVVEAAARSGGGPVRR
ncbi:hypothetical protein [Streptomyces johnsoniae]|uniref:Hydrolase n=1 Tax=Streptomyces johnsoniae TaxID=3075532 RepID=A0ABU2S5B7_9ACTN|nr:hypothetical protein [Streptomyces sp. DSM 41886]MDT0443881.1 hypothetical protein [Streptomyces sp. DSM 41886]